MNRRNTAPAAALRAIRARLKGRALPKITPRAAAPAPARAAKRKVDVAASRAISFSAAAAPLTSSPGETRSSTSTVFMTLFMSTPTGGPATSRIFCACDSPDCTMRITISPSSGNIRPSSQARARDAPHARPCCVWSVRLRKAALQHGREGLPPRPAARDCRIVGSGAWPVEKRRPFDRPHDATTR